MCMLHHLESRVSDSSMCPLLPNTPAIPLQRINNKLMVEDKQNECGQMSKWSPSF